jgi:hypothetical protein
MPGQMHVSGRKKDSDVPQENFDLAAHPVDGGG